MRGEKDASNNKNRDDKKMAITSKDNNGGSYSMVVSEGKTPVVYCFRGRRYKRGVVVVVVVLHTVRKI